MKNGIALALSAAVSLAAPAAAEPPADDRARLLDHLAATRKLFLDSVAGLSEEQLRFKAGEDRWSIAEVAEHVAASEEFIRGTVEAFLAAPATPEELVGAGGKVDTVLTFIVDRSQQFQAPEPVRPVRRFASLAETLRFFDEHRARTVALVERAPDLGAHAREHPAFGPLDATGWLFFLSGHTERHTLQIEEVKADPAFPAS